MKQISILILLTNNLLHNNSQLRLKNNSRCKFPLKSIGVSLRIILRVTYVPLQHVKELSTAMKQLK